MKDVQEECSVVYFLSLKMSRFAMPNSRSSLLSVRETIPLGSALALRFVLPWLLVV
jgi:hypothetical protein